MGGSFLEHGQLTHGYTMEQSDISSPALMNCRSSSKKGGDPANPSLFRDERFKGPSLCRSVWIADSGVLMSSKACHVQKMPFKTKQNISLFNICTSVCHGVHLAVRGELVWFSSSTVGSKDCTQVARPSCEDFCPLNSLASPEVLLQCTSTSSGSFILSTPSSGKEIQKKLLKDFLMFMCMCQCVGVYINEREDAGVQTIGSPGAGFTEL